MPPPATPLALWLVTALLALLSAGSIRAQRPTGVLPGSIDPVQSTSPQDWAQRILTTCQSEESRWEESRAALETKLTATAQSEEQLTFAQLELRARRKRLEEQRRSYFARLEYLHLGGKAKSLEPVAERYRQAAGVARPKAKNAFRRTLALLFGRAATCNLDALESTLFFAIFDLNFTPERFEPGLGIERVHAELERAYHERREKSGSLEEAYSGLRPADPEKAFAYADELIGRLAMMGALRGAQPSSRTPTAQHNVGQNPETNPEALGDPTPGSPEHRSPESSAGLQALLQELQRYFRLAAEPIRIQVYLHAKVQELEGALRTSIADRTTEKLFDHAEEALFRDEQAMRDLSGAAPQQVLATLQQVLDRWFRQEGFPALRRALYEDPFSAYWFFVQSGMVAQRPLAFKGSRVRVDSSTPELESLKGLSLPEVVSRLRQERIPSEFVASHAMLEETLAEVTLGRDDALRRTDAADLNNKDRANMRRYVTSMGETDVLSTTDVYSWVLRDASKIHGALDWHVVRAILKVLDQAKEERLQQEISATLDSSSVTERARLARYLRILGDLMREIDLRQATDSRFQEVTHGGVTGWVLRHFLLGTGVPVQLRTPGGVTGKEFAELLDEVGPKNKKSGNLYRGKPTNEIRFIHEGREFHEALVEAIDSAQSFLNLTSLDWKPDQGGKEIAYRIMAKKLGFEARSYEAFLETFRDGLPLHPGAAPTCIYDIPPSRMKNLLFYFFFKSTDVPAVAETRRQLERALDGELACPSVANCGDLSRLRTQVGDKYDPRRALERGYKEIWETYRKLEALFEENNSELRAATPRMALAEYVADRGRLQRFVRRHGRRRADDPTQPFPVNIIVDSKQDLFNLRWHRPNERYPYFFSDPIWDVYVPLYDFDVHLMQWKGVIEFPWHVGRLPWGGRKIFSVIPFPYVPYPWLGSVPGFGWAGIGSSLLLQHMLATDPRTWYAMVMHTKSVSSESVAIESGMGMGTKYFNPYTGFATWHDMGVKVRGPIVGDVNDHFVQMFNEARVNNTGLPRSRGVKIPELRYKEYGYAGAANASGYRTWVVTTHPEKGDSNYRGVFVAALAAARKNIYIENPFFTDPLVAHMLVHKAREFSARVNCVGLGDFECGEKRRAAVRIFLVLPDSTDQPIVDVVGHADLHEMLHHGVKIYRWNPQRGWSATKMLHTKAWLIDYEEGQPALAYSGSANATQRSHLTDNEMGILSTSPDFARDVYERLFRRDLTTDSRLLSTENLHTAWSTKPVARTARGMRKVLVSLFWVF